MKSKLFFVLFITLPLLAEAQTASNFRILLHSTKTINGNFGIAGWVVAPNITNNPQKWVGIAGVRYETESFWAEFMGGAINERSNLTGLLDARQNFTQLKPITFWANEEWTFGQARSFYFYIQADYWIAEIFAAGIETENTVLKKNGEDNLSYGPHIVLPIGKMTLIGAYQYHNKSNDQFWMRLVVDL